ncbi:uncharacterized protein LOC126328952 isoform X2 [Schistocerca gregaria]|uniref:uncharacterized protein LOC126328952 isoform X2 n=1 Tax=Schistocerca gregaria TaxID=7010 RepID=UPI00211F26C4|nr:uncharacterized protein LOC126328952 isoform X2 [Schistocerca gregaria]
MPSRKSRNMEFTVQLASAACWVSWTNRAIWISHDCCVWKPCCFLQRRFTVSRNVIISLQYLLLGLLMRSVYEVYQALIAIYTYFEAELWPTMLLVLECSLLGISLPVLPIHPMIFIMLIWWLLPYTYMLMKLYKTYKRLQYINDC